MARKRAIYISYFSFFLLMFVFLIWKCHYGYANLDESFYLTIPFRLCKGDCLIVDEWHPSQLSSFLLYPVMKIFLWITNNSTEGIMLSFRYIFTTVWAANAYFLFFQLRSRSLSGAIFSSFFFLLYTPFGIMALSYNSMGILLLLDACVLIATAEKANGLQNCLAGLLYAGAVLCCPHLIILYVLFTATTIVARKHFSGIVNIWLMATFGCIILFVVFCVYIFLHTSPTTLLKSIPELFNDPEHTSQSVIQVTNNYILSITKCTRSFAPCLLIALIATVVSKLKNNKAVGFIVVIWMIIVIQIDFLIRKPYLNFLMFPINLIAPYCVLQSKEKKIQSLFWIVWIPGLIYTYCINLGSNQGFYAISSASTVMTIASVMTMIGFISELKHNTNNKILLFFSSAMVAILLGLQLCSEFVLRYSSVFWEDQGMKAQTVLVDSGTEKGIFITPILYERYWL